MNEGTPIDSLPVLPDRPADGHKGTFGTVLVIGGQCGGGSVMLGGPALTAIGALRSGAGLSILAMPKPVLREALIVAPSATGLALPVEKSGAIRPSKSAALLDEHIPRASCVAIGPGFGVDEPQQQLVIKFIAQDEKPIVVDADAINCLAELPDFRGDLRAPAILTPHPGEYERLAKALSISSDPKDPSSRPAAAAELARRLGCVVVLKGHHTVISDGMRTAINDSGNVALATGGSGDVLTGVIAGFVAQFYRHHLGAGSRQITPSQQGGLSLFDCARLGVFVCGMAADFWATQHGRAGMLASDLPALIPDVLNRLRSRSDSETPSSQPTAP